MFHCSTFMHLCCLTPPSLHVLTISFAATRTEEGLRSRWQIIQKDLVKFNGIYVRTLAKRESGMSPEDQVNEALQAFEEVTGSKFAYLHAWDEIKHLPKFTSACASASTSANPRPPGAKATKAAVKMETKVSFTVFTPTPSPTPTNTVPSCFFFYSSKPFTAMQ